jgi:hypothetical protein
MKRFYTFAIALVFAATITPSLWSQAGGTVGSSTNTGTVGSSAATGTAGTGAVVGQNPTAPTGAGTNFNVGGINPTPFFSDPGVRQQLNLNDTQFNNVNRAYLNAFNRYNQSVQGLGALNPNTNAINSRREQLQDFRSRINNPNLNNNPNATAGTTNAAEQRARQLQAFENRFNSDFSPMVDQTFTDPRLRRRYDQLYRQYLGFNNFNDPTIQRQLNLTTEQRQQLRQLTSDWRRQMMDWRRGLRADDPAAQQQWMQFRNQYNDQLNAILTPQQQQLWLSLMGQPYEFPYTVYFPPSQAAPAADGSPSTGQTQPGTDTAVEPYGGGTVR